MSFLSRLAQSVSSLIIWTISSGLSATRGLLWLRANTSASRANRHPSISSANANIGLTDTSSSSASPLWSSTTSLKDKLEDEYNVLNRKFEREKELLEAQTELSTLQGKLLSVERELSRMTKLRQDERTGRINAEKKLKDLLLKAQQSSNNFNQINDSNNSSKQEDTPSENLNKSAEGAHPNQKTTNTKFCYEPIGYLQSCFRERRGTPRQPNLAPDSRAYLKLASFTQPSSSLIGLDQFSHVWLVFHFSANTNVHAQFKAKIQPPRLGQKVGVFSTRTPHRPNDIGLSVAKIDKVENGILYLSGIDLIDGTPILDIKPYVPYVDSISQDKTKSPSWVAQDNELVDEKQISFSEASHRQAQELVAKCDFFQDADTLKRCIVQVIKQDFRSVHQKDLATTNYHFRLDRLMVYCLFQDQSCVVESIALFTEKK